MKKALILFAAMVTSLGFVTSSSAANVLIASTSDRSLWQLWNRYDNRYYEPIAQPDKGIKFAFDFADQASAGALSGYSDPAYEPGVQVSTSSTTLFKGGYLVASSQAFGLTEPANLSSRTLTADVVLKISGKSPVFLYPADEANDLSEGANRNVCASNPKVALYFEATGDAIANGYWYLDQSSLGSANGFMSLADIVSNKGKATLQATLDPGNWIDTNGTSGSADGSGFAEAVAAVNNVGITIGGGCFAATGVALSTGTAKSGSFQLAALTLSQ